MHKSPIHSPLGTPRMSHWLQSRAKAMRHTPTLCERRLWAILRNRQLEGLKFRRQVSIGRYIVDFVCFQHRLIIEADGPHHETRTEDAERDNWLREQDFRVLRFSNQQIENRPHEVLAMIIAACSEITPPA